MIEKYIGRTVENIIDLELVKTACLMTMLARY